MKHLKVVCALIENDKGEIFCCLRGDGKALSGYWEFPGGKIETSETKVETIVREIKEELKSEIVPIKYLGESYYEYPALNGFNEFAITLYGYKCKLIKGDLILTEHKAKARIKPRDFNMELFAQADRPFIKLLQNDEE